MRRKKNLIKLKGDAAKDAIYTLCNRKQYFTGGSVSTYEKMFELASNGRPVNEIAVVIWACSHNATLSQVNEDVRNALYVEVGNENSES